MVSAATANRRMRGSRWPSAGAIPCRRRASNDSRWTSMARCWRRPAMTKRALQPLAVDRVPLQGTNLVEASAGTGKTWTIVALYVRLLLERRIPVEQILVVTFTKAATGELKARVLERLVALRDAWSKDVEALRDSDDPLLRHVARQCSDPARDVAWLTAAIESFDLAPIHTIHAFCQ